MADGTQSDLGERIRGIELVIASGGTTSSSMPLHGWVPVALEVPATLTSTSLTFTQCRTPSGTYLPVYSDSGSAYTVTVDTAQARHIVIDPAKMVGVSNLKVVMGSAEDSDRTLALIMRRID